MNKEQIFGVIRHTLTFVGGLLVMNGLIDQTSATELSGAIMSIVGAIWSIASKTNQNQ